MDETFVDDHVDPPARAPAPATPPAVDVPYELIVVETFDGRARGEVITDPDQVRQTLESGWAAHVVKRSKAA